MSLPIDYVKVWSYNLFNRTYFMNLVTDLVESSYNPY